jgi:hypothetical protein
MIMKKQKFYESAAMILFTLLIMTSIVPINALGQIPKTSGSAPMKNIVIDGVINEAEWADRDWKIKFYLDIDEVFNPPDKDGWNYLYLGEDVSNLYVGLDLCSDQTGDLTDEWVGVWLNVNNRSFDSLTTWANYLDNGTESLLHDVENDAIFPFFSDQLRAFQGGWDLNSDDEYVVIYGTTEGDYTNFDDFTVPTFNITSEFITGENLTQIDFSIDVEKWFTLFPEIYADGIQNMRLYVNCRSSVSIDEHKVVFWYNNGTMNPDDPQQTKILNTGTGWVQTIFDYGVGNLTSDNKMQFSIMGNNSGSFTTYFDQVEFAIQTNQTNTFGGALTSAYSSISNYNIEWSFGPSVNNASDHRMFEIKIPKAELEHYDADEDIGIIVGGYGTMTFPNELFWVFGAFNNSIRPQRTESYEYYNMGGCVAPSGSAIPGFYIPIIIVLIIIFSIPISRKRKFKVS